MIKLKEAKNYNGSLNDEVRAMLRVVLDARFDVHGKPLRPLDPRE